MKRTFVLLMILLGAWATISAEIYSGSCGQQLSWTLDSESGALVITGSGYLSVSSTYNYAWKEHAAEVQSVVIPEGVTDMDNAAFGTCTNLTTVVWNATNCDHFSAYNTAPFYDYNYVTVKHITSFTFGPNVKRIPAYLCYNMSSLTELAFPSTVTIIGQAAFYGCKGLTEIILPEGLTAMGSSAFSACTNLASVNIPTTLTQIYSYAFQATALSSIELHDGITYIGNYAFSKCPITEVTIPAGVTEVGNEAFSGCPNLTKVVWNAVYCDHFSAYNSTPFYEYGSASATRITSFTFGPNVKRIPAYLCYEMSSLTELALPSTVTIIGQAAFYSCKGLTEIILPEGLTAMGSSAFSACTNLASVNIPTTLTQIYSYAFQATALPSIELHDGITYIGNYAFSKCPITEVTIPTGVTEIGSCSFSACPNLTKVVWNAVNCDHFSAYNTTPFYESGYASAKRITSFEFGANVKRIPAYLCWEMTNLESISIPATVTIIGNNAFAYCEGLKTIFNYSSTPQSINANVFSGVDKVACSLYVPKSAMGLYEEAAVWKEFFRTEMDPVYVDLYETACDEFEWDEVKYTASQDISKTLKAKNGNDSIVTLHLTINYSSAGEEMQDAIGSYEWHGMTLTESGDYEYTLTNAAGCDSVATLHLTVTPVWEVTVIQPEHGTIACLEDIVLSHATDKATLHFEAYPDEHYILDQWIGCEEDGTLTVTENVTVTCTFKEDKPTMIESTESAHEIVKFIKDSHLYILHNDRKYTITGTEVK